MFWADRIAQNIIKSGKYTPFWVDDMFTPSGYAHMGSLRGPLIHDLVYQALIDAGEKAKYTYVFNDFDPIDGLPDELQERFSRYLGFPLRTAPSPEPGFDSFAQYFSTDFRSVLQKLGVKAEFLSSWDMYHQGKFNNVIKIALDNAEKIQDIYQKVSGSKKREKGWLPLQVICEKCGKLGTTRVYQWNGKTVKYICEPQMVKWATGCDHKGEISPYDGNGKLPWKVDWPAHWAVLGVTIEGAGKDHSSAGGSRDIAKALCEEVFHIRNPYNIPYEFFLIGGRKMSSSKGLGVTARNLTELLPAEIGRFLFSRTDYRQAIEFDPIDTMAIPDLFDEYDRCWTSFNKGVNDSFARTFELSQPQKVKKNKNLFIPRFRDVANYLQLPNVDLTQKFSELKSSNLSEQENKILKERTSYAKVWLNNYAPQEYRVQVIKEVPASVSTLTAAQKEYLKHVIEILTEKFTPEELQLALYNLAKENKIDPKLAFQSIYLPLLGKSHGPKAAWLILQENPEFIKKRFNEAINYKSAVAEKTYAFEILKRPELFSIDRKVKQRFSSINVGLAVIKNITVPASHAGLDKEISDFVSENKNLTTTDIGSYP
ncbi:lysine--tRNA ligase, partial [Candidatus Gottesmanbacteria bacterium RBG_16_37_8]